MGRKTEAVPAGKPGGEVTHRTFAPVGDERASETVIRAVMDVSGESVDDLEPLFRTVDPDALNALVDGRTGVEATFAYEGYRVTVRPGEVVVAAEPVG
jgi:hypothetical protein